MTKKNSKSKLKVQKKIIIEAILIAIVLAAGVLATLYVVPTINNGLRKNRIVSIYDSLNLDTDAYQLTSESVFGDKRIYEYDAGRSYSSAKYYLRNANVDTTVAELKKAVTDIGFTFHDEAYSGSTSVQYHYKSTAGEYIRISVESKSRSDAFWNKTSMGISITPADRALDKNLGPSLVTVKVNLDDNNE